MSGDHLRILSAGLGTQSCALGLMSAAGDPRRTEGTAMSTWILFFCTWVGGMAAGATLQGILDDSDDRKRRHGIESERPSAGPQEAKP